MFLFLFVCLSFFPSPFEKSISTACISFNGKHVIHWILPYFPPTPCCGKGTAHHVTPRHSPGVGAKQHHVPQSPGGEVKRLPTSRNIQSPPCLFSTSPLSPPSRKSSTPGKRRGTVPLNSGASGAQIRYPSREATSQLGLLQQVRAFCL